MSDLRTIRKELRELKEILAVSDLINEKEACKFLGVSLKTLMNRVYDGTLSGAYIVNRLGHRMFYRSKLVDPLSEPAEHVLGSKSVKGRS